MAVKNEEKSALVSKKWGVCLEKRQKKNKNI